MRVEVALGIIADVYDDRLRVLVVRSQPCEALDRALVTLVG